MHDKFVKVSSCSTKAPTRIKVRGEWNDHFERFEIVA